MVLVNLSSDAQKYSGQPKNRLRFQLLVTSVLSSLSGRRGDPHLNNVCATVTQRPTKSPRLRCAALRPFSDDGDDDVDKGRNKKATA